MDSFESQVASQANDTAALWTHIASGWVPSPNFRGTSDILQSCIATLISCVYTAIHLNVPPGEVKGRWSTILEKLKWVAVAILAPEIVLYNAVSQFLEARWLQKELKRLRRWQKSTSSRVAAMDVEPGEDRDGQVSQNLYLTN